MKPFIIACSNIPNITDQYRDLQHTSVVSSKLSTEGSIWEADDHFVENPCRADVKVFNISGTIFLVDMSIFVLYPDTLLGSSDLERYYVPSRDQYFIEHSKHVFPAVVRFYTHQEELFVPPCLPKEMFEEALEFYGLLPYFQGLKSVIRGPPEPLVAQNWKQTILYTMQFPTFSNIAKICAIVDICIIIMSTVTLVLESIPELTELDYFQEVADILEASVNIYFTLQAILLLAVYSSWAEYFRNANNWIDIISVLPFYLRLMAPTLFNQVGGFRVLRVIRLLRVMKLFRHSQGSQVMMNFLFSSIPEITLLLLMWGIGVLIFGPLIFFIEHTHGDNQFQSAFSGMWFCVVTIGTVGYGDLAPATNFGKTISAIYTILNLTVMTIPISIIITKFSRSMRK